MALSLNHQFRFGGSNAATTGTLTGSTSAPGSIYSAEYLLRSHEYFIPIVVPQTTTNSAGPSTTNFNVVLQHKAVGALQPASETAVIRAANLYVETTVVSGSPTSNGIALYGTNNPWNVVGQLSTAALVGDTSLVLKTGQGAAFNVSGLASALPQEAFILSYGVNGFAGNVPYGSSTVQVLGWERITYTGVSTDTLTGVVRSTFTQPLIAASTSPPYPAQNDPYQLPAQAWPINSVVVTSTDWHALTTNATNGPGLGTNTFVNTASANPGAQISSSVALVQNGVFLNQFKSLKALVYGPSQASSSASFVVRLAASASLSNQTVNAG